MFENDDVTSQAHQHSHGKQRLKRCVLRWLRKTGSDCADMTCCDRLFQIQAATTRKAQSPTVDHHVRWMTSNDDKVECSRYHAAKSADSRCSSVRYDGAADTCRQGDQACSQLSPWNASFSWNYKDTVFPYKCMIYLNCRAKYKTENAIVPDILKPLSKL